MYHRQSPEHLYLFLHVIIKIILGESDRCDTEVMCFITNVWYHCRR